MNLKGGIMLLSNIIIVVSYVFNKFVINFGIEKRATLKMKKIILIE